MPTAERFLNPLVERRYQQYVEDMHGELDVPRLCEVMWNAGARNAVQAMTAWAEIMPSLRRIEGKAVEIRQLLELLVEES